MTLIIYSTYDDKELSEELFDILDQNYYNVCIPIRVKKGTVEIYDNDPEKARKQYYEIIGILYRKYNKIYEEGGK